MLFKKKKKCIEWDLQVSAIKMKINCLNTSHICEILCRLSSQKQKNEIGARFCAELKMMKKKKEEIESEERKETEMINKRKSLDKTKAFFVRNVMGKSIEKRIYCNAEINLAITEFTHVTTSHNDPTSL